MHVEGAKKMNSNFSGNRGGYSDNRLPKDYLSNGYFDEKGYIREELLTTVASEVAKSFGFKMSNSQLRRFYGHLKNAEKSFLFSNDVQRFIVDVKQLDAFVAEAKGKDKVPAVFYDFIHQNIRRINNVKDIRKGFLPHFQAVVAYFTYHYPKSR